jgi:hypothetical protein
MQIMVKNVTLILKYPVSSCETTTVDQTDSISSPVYLILVWVNVMNGFPPDNKPPYHLIHPASVTVGELWRLDSYQQFGIPVRGSNIINGLSEPSCNVICSGQNTGKLT